MLKAFSTAATGMEAQQAQIDVIANNLANVSTNGYKRSQVNFQDLLYIKLREADRDVASGVMAPSGLEIGTGVRVASTTKNFVVGDVQSTGGELDVAIQGDGLFKVTLPSGEERYTRDGAFQRDANGLVVTGSGYQVSPGVTVPQDAISVDIAPDGTVSALTPAGKQVLGTLEIYRFPNNAGLSSEGGNLYRETDASGSPVAGKAGELGCGSLLSKYLEKSNVEMVTELVNLINAQRAYEINSRTIRTGDNILQQLSQLIR